MIDRRRERVSARAADEDEAAWVAEMFRTFCFDLRISFFHEEIVGMPMAGGKPRWLYQGRRQRQLDATDRHAICGDGRPRAYHQPVEHPPHTAEREGDCIEASGCELFSAAHHPAITLSKARPQKAHHSFRGPWSKDREPPHLGKGPRDPGQRGWFSGPSVHGRRRRRRHQDFY